MKRNLFLYWFVEDCFATFDMRDNFSENTKKALAARVAYRCSFPGCGRTTIGPETNTDNGIVSIGEAAHIYSASPKGPRNNPSLTAQERTAISNGIWMCKNHARLIDADEGNFSAETLLKWKKAAEQEAYGKLETLDKEVVFQDASTLVMLELDLVFNGEWIFASNECWEFKVNSFVEGNLSRLLDYVSAYNEEKHAYVIIESQGDGRMLNGLSWRKEGSAYVIGCKIAEKINRNNPHAMGSDLAIGEDGDLVFADNDIKMVHGIDNALQIIRTALCSEFGDWKMNPLLGSNFNTIVKRYGSNPDVLNSMIKMEIVRLFTVPIPSHVINRSIPELNFINRVHSVRIGQHNEKVGYLPVMLALEWGNREYWEGEIKVPM